MAKQEKETHPERSQVLELSHIYKSYFTAVETPVLFDINLDFALGSFNSIIGQSGSGKSTLMNIMGTLDRPTKGEVVVDGRDTSKLGKNQLAQLRNETIGFVFQFHYLLPEFTALENVLMPKRIQKGAVSETAEARANELLDLMGLTEVKENLATNMSGGQQQRVAIARALMNQPKIILADEPTGNLDSETTDTIYDLFSSINAQFETTFIIVTHDRKVAERTNRIIELRDGKVLMDVEK